MPVRDNGSARLSMVCDSAPVPHPISSQSACSGVAAANQRTGPQPACSSDPCSVRSYVLQSMRRVVSPVAFISSDRLTYGGQECSGGLSLAPTQICRYGMEGKPSMVQQPMVQQPEKANTMKFDRELISNDNPMEMVVGFSRAVRVGPFISVGGTAPVDRDGKTVGIGDVAAQTRQCIEI